MLFTAMMTQPEISPFEDIITVRYDTLSAVRRLFAVAIKYSPVTPTHLSHISSFNRLSINTGSGTNTNNEHSQLKRPARILPKGRAFPLRKKWSCHGPGSAEPRGQISLKGLRGSGQCSFSSLWVVQSPCLLNSKGVAVCSFAGPFYFAAIC